jgi:hypothetical protein
MDRAFESIHQREIFKGQQLEAPVRVVELMDHYQATGEALGRLAANVRNFTLAYCTQY